MLAPTQARIVQQVFNSIEEVTENTPGDTNTARVAEFKTIPPEHPDSQAIRRSPRRGRRR